jgi:hypothetical protein
MTKIIVITINIINIVINTIIIDIIIVNMTVYSAAFFRFLYNYYFFLKNNNGGELINKNVHKFIINQHRYCHSNNHQKNYYY